MKGIIFDFNGTLFYDTPLHIEAWRVYSEKLRGYPLTDEEMYKHMVGHTNGSIIEYCLGNKPDNDFILELSREKEQIYRDMCISNPINTKLVDGAIDLLDFLKEKNIPRTIATGSDWENVDFFIKTFNLEKWFDIPKIVFNDGTHKGKPAPDGFLIAAEKLNLPIEECVVVEDAFAGIESAKRAGAGKIIAIAPDEKKEEFYNIDCISCVISDFTEFDKSVFC